MTETQEPLLRGSETILIVDDDEMIRDFGKALLSHLGYSVLLAGDATEGLVILKRESPRVRLVLLDLIMAGMSGHEFYTRVRQTDPGVRFLITSGLDFFTARNEFADLDQSWYIMKPFGIHTLSRAVRNAIDGKTSQ